MALILRDVRIAEYRSLRSIHFPVGRLSVFVGANGVGKTNLYRALELLQASAAEPSPKPLPPRAAWNRPSGPAKAAARAGPDHPEGGLRILAGRRQ